MTTAIADLSPEIAPEIDNQADLRAQVVAHAEQVLPIFESAWPLDTRPRLAIQAAKNYLDGKKSHMASHRIAANEAARDSGTMSDQIGRHGHPVVIYTPASYAALAAAGTCDDQINANMLGVSARLAIKKSEGK